MKKLIIESNKYGLRKYCSKCFKWLSDKNDSSCNHYENQVYKSRVSIANNKYKVKIHDTKGYGEALAMAIQFKRDVKNGVFEARSNTTEIDTKQITVLDAANLYMNYKHGINIPSHLKEDFTKGYLGKIKKAIKDLILVLERKGFNLNSMPLNQLNDSHVGYWYEYQIDDMEYANGSFNTNLSCLRTWINHMKEFHAVEMVNPFKKVKTKEVDSEIVTIAKDEFESVINSIGTEPSCTYLGGKAREKKNFHRRYLKDAYQLALNTGLRREEFVTLSWDDIYLVKETGGYMVITDNKKVERITGKKYKKKYVPVHKALAKFLNEMGWQELKGSDMFIIEPMRTVKVKTIMDACSKGFSHYWKKVYPDQPLKQMECLRNTYLTYLNKLAGDDTIHFSSHSDVKVLENHYLNPAIVAKGEKMNMWE